MLSYGGLHHKRRWGHLAREPLSIFTTSDVRVLNIECIDLVGGLDLSVSSCPGIGTAPSPCIG